MHGAASRLMSGPYRKLDAPVQESMTKSGKIRAAWAAGDPIGALRIAARFFDRLADTQMFKRGMDAHNHPDFYRQLGQEPEEITGPALRRLADKFHLARMVNGSAFL